MAVACNKFTGDVVWKTPNLGNEGYVNTIRVYELVICDNPLLFLFNQKNAAFIYFFAQICI
jgi:hypothetical protein